MSPEASAVQAELLADLRAAQTLVSALDLPPALDIAALLAVAESLRIRRNAAERKTNEREPPSPPPKVAKSAAKPDAVKPRKPDPDA